MTVSKTIQERIKGIPTGEPFSLVRFLNVGTRGTVDQNIHRLERAGVIKRIGRGLYMRPKQNGVLGETPVPLHKAIREYATARRETIEASGAEAANRLGLSTQVPAKSVYWTTGVSRNVHIGNRVVTLKHKGKKALLGAGTIAAPIITALYYLGPMATNETVIQRIRGNLTTEQREAVGKLAPQALGWMRGVLLKICVEGTP